ncbi:MAG: hypothetical protein ABFS17_06805 [Chloroflexota bacterium]
MSHRERMLAAVNHQPIDEFRTDIKAVPAMWEKLEAHFGIKKVIIGESERCSGTAEFLEQHGVEVINLDWDSCK